MSKTHDDGYRFDPTSPDVRRDPYPAYRWLRERAPVYQAHLNGQNTYVVSRYDDVVSVLRNPETYSSAIAGPRSLPYMISADPPEHTRLRAVVLKAFTPTRIQSLAEPIERLAEEMLQLAVEQERCEWIDTVANPLPAAVIAMLLGIPLPSMEAVRTWSEEVLHLGLGDYEGGSAVPPGTLEFLAYLLELLRSPGRIPPGGLLTSLRDISKQGDLSERELLLFAVLLVVAGHTTTTHVIGNGVKILCDQPALLDELRRDPTRTADFVEEVLRYESPLQSRVRRVLRPTRVHETEIEPGALVLALIGSANRDPARFPDPDVYDLNRDASRHIAFGSGLHACLGAALARLESTLFFRVFARRVTSIGVDPDRPPRLMSEDIALAWRGFSQLHVCLRG